MQVDIKTLTETVTHSSQSHDVMEVSFPVRQISAEEINSFISGFPVTKRVLSVLDLSENTY